LKEPIDYIAFAERKLADAERIFAIGLYEVAAREAYLAAMNAARGLILLETGKTTKSHKGVRSQLWKLIHDGIPFDRRLAKFLVAGFEIKVTTDYVNVGEMTSDATADALSTARSFLNAAKALIESKG
jgi:uncharacterized protein (UPF0332 family)